MGVCAEVPTPCPYLHTSHVLQWQNMSLSRQIAHLLYKIFCKIWTLLIVSFQGELCVYFDTFNMIISYLELHQIEITGKY